MRNDGLQVPASQQDALRAIPAGDMLVDPAQLQLVLEEPATEDGVTWIALAGWTLTSLAATVIAALWWVATGH